MSLFQLARDGDAGGLCDALAVSENPAVRARAAELLGEADEDGEAEPEVVDALVRAVREDESRVRVAAVDSLAELGPAAVDALLDALLGPPPDEGGDWARAEALTGSLRSDRPALRMASANALGRLGVPDATPALVEALDDADARVRERVARALGALEDPRAGRGLTDHVSDDVADVRVAATEALGRLGGQEALAGLLRALDDPDSRVREIAVACLGDLGELESARPLDALGRALDDPAEGVRRGAVFATLELLSTAPAATSHDLRETVLERLRADRRGDVVAPLAQTLAESSGAAQRRNAAWLLGRVTADRQRERAIDALANALGDEDGTVVQFAATSLVELGGEDVEAATLDRLDDVDADAEARAKAAFVLGRVGGAEARATLDRLVDEAADESLRRQAFSALSRLGGEPA